MLKSSITSLALAAAFAAVTLVPRPAYSALTWDNCKQARQDPEKAIAACTEILKTAKSGRRAEALHNRSIAYAARGDIDKAIADASEGIRLDPRRAYRFQERGELYFKIGDFTQALSDFNEAIKLDATRAFRFHWRGLAYSSLGNFSAAIADFTEAIRLDPKRGSRFYDRANAYRAAEQYALAISDYDQALQLDPTNGKAFVGRGRAHARNDQIALARSDFEAALRIAGNANPRLRQAATDEMAALIPEPREAVAPLPVGSTPGSAPSTGGTTSAATATPPTAFAEGLADRQAWEKWFASLTGDFKKGAEYWAGQRSLANPGSCYAPDGSSTGDWTQGCLAAQRQLAASDARRNAGPEYKEGWNSFTPSAATLTVTPVASAAASSPPPRRAVAQPQTGREAEEEEIEFLPIEGQCQGIAILGVDRGSRCSLLYLAQGVARTFMVRVTPTGVLPSRADSWGPEHALMTFVGYEINPEVWRNMGEFFVVIKQLIISQRSDIYPAGYVHPKNAGKVVRTTFDGGASYCEGHRIQFGNGSWTVECRGDTDHPTLFRFRTDDPLP